MTRHKHEDAVSSDTTLSMREYAKRRGVNVSTVSRAIHAGKLAGAVVQVGGELRISSKEAADEAWERNTRPLPTNQPRATGATGRPSAALPPDFDPDTAPPPPLDGEVTANDYFKHRAIREAALARKERALAVTAELELQRVQGILVDAQEVRAQLVEAVTRAKTHLLGIPTKLRQRCPHLAAEDLVELTQLIRGALEELADGKA